MDCWLFRTKPLAKLMQTCRDVFMMVLFWECIYRVLHQIQMPYNMRYTISKPQGQMFLAAARDWKMAAHLKEALHFPHHIAHTQERPDIVIWSDTVKRVIIVELTVSWEENMEEAFERKKLRYENLRMECEDKGWACQVMPIQVGCRGFIGRTTTSYLTRLGLTNRARRRATQQLQTAAERASSWIWSKVRKSTTAWLNRPPSSLLPYPHPIPPHPQPSPTLSLPPPTTSIPIPSSSVQFIIFIKVRGWPVANVQHQKT